MYNILSNTFFYVYVYNILSNLFLYVYIHFDLMGSQLQVNFIFQ